MSENIESKERCAICMDDSFDHITSCGHHYHKRCLHTWLRAIPKCPLCRTIIDIEDTMKMDQHLIIASSKGELEQVQVLVAQGANINGGCLQSAAKYGHFKVVEYLVEHGADINIDNSEPLRWASTYGKLIIVRYLVSKGADITAFNHEAVRFARSHGHLTVTDYLISKGAKLYPY